MKKLSNLLILLGILAIAFPFAQNFYHDYQNDKIVQEIENRIESTNHIQLNADINDEVDSNYNQLSEVFSDYNQSSDYQAKLSYFEGYVGTDDISNSLKPQENLLLLNFNAPDVVESADGLKYLGTINIPSIDLNMPLVDGTTDRDIAVSAGHMINTAYPGQIGNSVIVGHRGYSHGRLFNRLDEMAPGDEIIVSVGDDEFSYTVYKTKTVLPTDTSVINQTNKAEVLTLITCTPLYSSEFRLIVHAVKK